MTARVAKKAAAPAAKSTSVVEAAKAAHTEVLAEVAFVYARATRNTILYEEVVEGDEPVCRSLYVAKSKLGKTVPQSITVTIRVTN